MLPKYGVYNFFYAMSINTANSLPVFKLPDGAMTVFDNISDYTAVIGHYVPIGTFLTCCAIVLSVWLVCTVISAILQLL